MKIISAPSADPEDVLKRANAVIQKKYEFFETTLQIERFQQEMDDCKQCIAPLKWKHSFALHLKWASKQTEQTTSNCETQSIQEKKT